MHVLRSRFKMSSAFVIALLVSTLLAACGDSTPTTASISATTAAATSTTAAAATSTTAAATTAAMIATTVAGGTTTTAAATTAAGTATTAAAAGGTPWVNTMGTIPAGLKTDIGIDSATKTINIASLLDLTGPAGNGGKVAAAATTTYFKGVNERGGIDGYKVNYTVYDTQYSPQVAVQQYNKAVGNVAMFSQILGTPIVGALQPQIDQDKIFSIVSSFASKWVKDPYMLIGGPTYRVELLNTVDYVVNKLGKKNPKIAFVFQDDSLGADVAVAFDTAIKTYGVVDAGRVGYKTTDKDFTAQATALKNSGADFVFIAGLYNQAQQIISTTSSLGFNPTYLMVNVAWDPSMFNTGAKDAVKDALFQNSSPTWDQTNVPIIAQMLGDIKKYDPNAIETTNYTLNYFLGMLTHAILKKALESGDATRAGIVSAVGTLKDVDVLGYLPPLTFGKTPNERVLTRAIRLGTPDASTASKTRVITDFFAGEAAKNYNFETAP